MRRGIRATALMSASFLVHPHLAPPPKIVAFNAARRVGIAPENLPPRLAQAYWITAHFGFGISLAIVRHLLQARTRGAAYGAPYGAVVWLANYALALPALRLYPSPARDDSLRAASSFFAHLVFGAALGATTSDDS